MCMLLLYSQPLKNTTLRGRKRAPRAKESKSGGRPAGASLVPGIQRARHAAAVRIGAAVSSSSGNHQLRLLAVHLQLDATAVTTAAAATDAPCAISIVACSLPQKHTVQDRGAGAMGRAAFADCLAAAAVLSASRRASQCSLHQHLRERAWKSHCISHHLPLRNCLQRLALCLSKHVR